MRERTSNISYAFRHIFRVINVSFLHFSQKRYGPTDGPTDRRTYPLLEMQGHTEDPDILAITDSWTNEITSNGYLDINGYEMMREGIGRIRIRGEEGQLD